MKVSNTPSAIFQENQAEWSSTLWMAFHPFGSWRAKGVERHPEGPGPVWAVDPWEPHEFQQGQVQSPATGSGQHVISMQTARWRDGQQTCWEGLGTTAGLKASNEAAVSSCSPEGQPYAGLYQKKVWPKKLRKVILPLYLSLVESPSGVLSLYQVMKKGQRKITIGLEQFCYENRLKELELFSLEKTPGRIYCGISVLKRDLGEIWGKKLCSRACFDRMGDNGFIKGR